MRRKGKEPELTVDVKKEEWDMELEGECVLRCVLTRPELTGTWKGIGAINRFYAHAAEVWRSRWECEVYCHACLDLADRRAQGRPFRVWCAEVETKITLRENGLLSLWQEGRETRGYEDAPVLRRGDTWSLAQGAPLPLASFFPKKRRWKKQVLEQLEEQIRSQLAAGESLLDADCLKRLRREFRPDNYWLTGEGAQVFFPMYTIAAGGEGIPTFCVSLPDR